MQAHFPLHLELRPARALASLLGAAHAASAGVLMFAVPVPAPLQLAVLALIAASAWRSVRRALLLAPRAIAALELKTEGACAVRERGEQAPWREAEAQGGVASPLLAIVKLKLEGERWARSVTITPDMLPPEDFRRLLVWLRWGLRV